MKKLPITREGYKILKRNLELLKKNDIPANIKAIEEARSHGDISENAEYSAAKEEQAFLQQKVQEIQKYLSLSQIVDYYNVNTDKIIFGSYVVIFDLNEKKKIQYQIVGPFESDLNKNKISVISPIGKSLIGKKIDDIIKVLTPRGIRKLKIINIFIK